MNSNKTQIWVAGGAVRDVLLGHRPKDVDYVIVNGSHDKMIKEGFQLVGAGFPVYLHPSTKEEYAFARVERKVGTGYNGFECETQHVTLEDDLKRRDLTINSMAVSKLNWDKFKQTADRKYIIDPYNGYRDLNDGVLRHTSEAFAEDPIRVLRAARFAARYGFTISLNTLNLMNQVVHELNDVPAERIWIEFEKGLKEHRTDLMLLNLTQCGAFKIAALFPYSHIDRLLEVKTKISPISKFALMSGGFSVKDYETCRIPTEYVKLSKIVNQYLFTLNGFDEQPPEIRVDIIINLKLMYDVSLLNQLIEIMNMYNFPEAVQQLQNDIDILHTIDAESIALSCQSGQEIKEKLRQARIEKLS